MVLTLLLVLCAILLRGCLLLPNPDPSPLPWPYSRGPPLKKLVLRHHCELPFKNSDGIVSPADQELLALQRGCHVLRGSEHHVGDTRGEIRVLVFFWPFDTDVPLLSALPFAEPQSEPSADLEF